MPWTINSEIYPLWARSTGNACAAGANWTFNVLVSLTFLHLAQYLTYYGQCLVSDSYKHTQSISVIGFGCQAVFRTQGHKSH